MKILVTGGAGFIGSHVVDAYLREGHDVVVVDNLSTGKQENINPSARFHPMDIRSDALGKLFEEEKPEILNHHAAQISVPESVVDPIKDADINVLGLLNLLESAVRHGTKKVIFISSGGAVYGESPNPPNSEELPPVPLSPYAISKLVSEHYLGFYRHRYGLDYTVLRYANIYGPRQIPHGEAGVVAVFMDKLLKGEAPVIYHYPEDPRGMTRDYCYVGDIVRANLLALSGGSAEVINIGTGIETHTLGLYLEILSGMRKMGYGSGPSFENPPRGPARPGDLKRSALDIEKAQRVLGWRPAEDLPSGIAKTLRWRTGRQ